MRRRLALVGIVVATLLVSLAVPAAASSGLFLDDDDSPFEGAIEAIAVEDVTVGCNPPHDTRFCPQRRITRQAAAAFLARALDLPAATRDHFTDDDGNAFEDEINAIAEAGITTGCTTGEAHFCPTRAVSRQAMAAFLTRGLELQPPGPVPRYQPPDEDFRVSKARPLSEVPAVRDRVVGSSWRSECREIIPLEDLRYIRMSYVGFDGDVRIGELVIRHDVVDDVRTAMRRTFEAGFPIRQMRLVDDFGADDGRSMGANNTSAFNCRRIAGTTRWSNHSYGTAIDINPRQNPWVRNGTYDPPEGEAYADRSDRRAGMLVAGTDEVSAWTDLGWDWGGTWSSLKDYQHFSEQGG